MNVSHGSEKEEKIKNTRETREKNWIRKIASRRTAWTFDKYCRAAVLASKETKKKNK